MKFTIEELKPFGAIISLVNADFDFSLLKELISKYKLLIIRGGGDFEEDKDFEVFCSRWGEICLWPFGKTLNLVEQIDPQDHIFDYSYIPMHWDGMFRPEIPEFQIFFCVNPGACSGGRSVFSNTQMAIKKLSEQKIEFWKNIEGFYERKMEFYKSITKSKIIAKHPYNDFCVIRYNEPHRDVSKFINPSEIYFNGVSKKEVSDFEREIKDLLYHPDHFYAHQWQRGDIVVSDNFTLLHGREKFTSGSGRHLKRVQILSEHTVVNEGLMEYQ